MNSAREESKYMIVASFGGRDVAHQPASTLGAAKTFQGDFILRGRAVEIIEIQEYYRRFREGEFETGKPR